MSIACGTEERRSTEDRMSGEKKKKKRKRRPDPEQVRWRQYDFPLEAGDGGGGGEMMRCLLSLVPVEAQLPTNLRSGRFLLGSARQPRLYWTSRWDRRSLQIGSKAREMHERGQEWPLSAGGAGK